MVFRLTQLGEAARPESVQIEKISLCFDAFIDGARKRRTGTGYSSKLRRTFIRFQVETLVAAALLTLAASPAFAGACSTALGCGGGGKAAPGPIAGAGLGYLVLAGGYYVVRRWRKRNTDE